MKKTIITTLVAVAALGFSGTSFAGPGGPGGGSSSSSSGLIDIGDVSLDLSRTISNTTNTTINKTENEWGVEADFKAPAAGGNIGQVAYDAPAVGGDLIDVSARAIAIQRGEVDPVYADLAFMGSGGVLAGSGDAAAGFAASLAASGSVGVDHALAGATAAGSLAGAAGGDSGYVSFTGITTGAVSTGAVTIDLSNNATALAIGGGSYNYSAVPAPVAP